MAVLHGSVDMLDDETGIFEDGHDFESSAQEFIKQNNWQEAATDKIDFSKHKELHSMNVINITGILSNDESIRTIPWTPVKKLPAKPIQPPSRPTPCYKSQPSWSQELVNRSQQTTPGNLFDSSIQTWPVQLLTCPSKPSSTIKNLWLIALMLLLLLPSRPRWTS